MYGVCCAKPEKREGAGELVADKTFCRIFYSAREILEVLAQQ